MKFMKTAAVVALIARLALPLMGQEAESGTGAECPAGADRESGDRLRFDASRVIEDRGTHQRWLLQRDLHRPAAPARLVPLVAGPSCAALNTRAHSARLQVRSREQLIPVIHTGDTLILSEHTSVSDARFEAIALSAADVGEAIRVRLKVGGRPLHAIATAPGQATLLVEIQETRP